MAAAASASPKNPWDHDQATKIFEGDDSASQLLKAKAVLHAQQMAKLSEQLQTLLSPERTPAPHEALVKAWLEAVAALSVDGKSDQVLSGPALEKALKGLQAKRVELAQTVSEFIAMQEQGSSSSPAPSRNASVPPQASGSGRGKELDNDVDTLDAQPGRRECHTLAPPNIPFAEPSYYSACLRAAFGCVKNMHW